MATRTTFSELDPAAALDGTEIVPIDQSSETVRTTTAAIAALGATTGLGYSIQSASFTATAGGRYGLKTGTAAITVTLPAVSTTTGLGIEIDDIDLSAFTNHITLSAHSGDTIALSGSSASSKTISTNGAMVRLVPSAANLWRAMLIASA